MNNKKIIVAIDGFSSSGKSTMARELAKRVGYVYVDSGAMYRAVTLFRSSVQGCDTLRHKPRNRQCRQCRQQTGACGRSSFNPCLFSAGGSRRRPAHPFEWRGCGKGDSRHAGERLGQPCGRDSRSARKAC